MPVGTKPEAVDTVAVNVTGCVRVDGFVPDVIAIVVGIFTTVCDKLATEPATVELPEYAAVMRSPVPRGKLEVVKVATPLTRGTVASTPACRKVTVPVGLEPDAAETVAVNVTA